MSSDASSELDPLHYARLHGLAADHLAEPFPMTYIEALQLDVPGTITENDGLLNIELPIYIPPEELAVPEGESNTFTQVLNGETPPLGNVDTSIVESLNIRQSKELRVEVPLLRSDHEQDFKAFARWEDTQFVDGCLPLEPLDDELDEGLGWPSKHHGTSARLIKETQEEKLELSRDAVLALQTYLKDSWTDEDEKKAWAKDMSRYENVRLTPLTPPLLHMTPPYAPYVHSSPDGRLPILSDPVSLSEEDARKAEEAIFDSDILLPSDFTVPDSEVESLGANNPNTHTAEKGEDLKAAHDEGSAVTYLKVSDLKVEPPLTPMLPPVALPKTVTFSDVVEEMLLDPMSQLDREGSVVDEAELEADKMFQDVLEEAANRVYHELEQEDLVEADARARVEVPVMDFTPHIAPWKDLEFSSNGANLLRKRRDLIETVLLEYRRPLLTRGMAQLDRQLRWTVFPLEQANVVLDEDIDGKYELQTFLEPNKTAVDDSGACTWVTSGLKLLQVNDSDDEDELEPGTFTDIAPQDISDLIRKRKKKLVEDSLSEQKSSAILRGTETQVSKSTADEDVSHDNYLRLQEGFITGRQKLNMDDKREALRTDAFSAGDALESFLEIRAAKRQKPISSGYFEDPNPIPMKHAEAPAAQAVVPADLPTMQNKASIMLPIPTVGEQTISVPYIISTAILKWRTFSRKLHSLFPSQFTIERDFSAHNTMVWDPHQVTRSPIISSLEYEADIIVSPSTGLVLTTLQKIKQRPLPGQKTKSTLKERLRRVALRYERLIILVSESAPDESTTGLAEVDTLALAEFNGFVTSLGLSTSVYFVAGGEETLAKWAVAVMNQYVLSGDTAIPLLEDETRWEIFLRRAGMNAFAAQAVLAQLKAPDGVDGSHPTKAGFFGIAGFMEMGQEERVARFAGLLGGRRVLDRVGQVLDSNWQ